MEIGLVVDARGMGAGGVVLGFQGWASCEGERVGSGGRRAGARTHVGGRVSLGVAWASGGAECASGGLARGLVQLLVLWVSGGAECASGGLARGLVQLLVDHGAIGQHHVAVGVAPCGMSGGGGWGGAGR